MRGFQRGGFRIDPAPDRRDIVVMLDLRKFQFLPELILPVLAGSFGVFLMRQFMETIPDEIIESARIDGASEYRIFFRMIMPMVKPAWLTLVCVPF